MRNEINGTVVRNTHKLKGQHQGGLDAKPAPNNSRTRAFE